MLPERGGVRVQVARRRPGRGADGGRSTVVTPARRTPPPTRRGPGTRRGVLGLRRPPAGVVDLAEWPPAGAEPVEPTALVRPAGRGGLRLRPGCSRGCGRPGGAATSCSPRSALPEDVSRRAPAVRPAPGAAGRRPARRCASTGMPPQPAADWQGVSCTRMARPRCAYGCGCGWRRHRAPWRSPTLRVSRSPPVDALRCRPLPEDLGGDADAPWQHLFRLDWTPRPTAEAGPDARRPPRRPR